MRSSSNEILAGLFIVVSVLALTAMLIMVGDYDRLFAKKQELRVSFHNIRGLKVGDPVYYAGLEIGTVKSISVRERKKKDGESETVMECILNVDEGYTFHKDSTATIECTLTNIVSVQINPGSGEVIKANPGEPLEIAAAEPPTLSEMTASLNSVLQDGKSTLATAKDAIKEIKKVATNVNDLIVRNKESLTQTIERTRVFAKNSAEISEKIQNMLSKDRSRIDELIANLHASSAQIRKTLDVVAPKVETTAEKLPETMQTLRQALKTLNNTLATVDLTVQENRPDIRAILAHLREVSEDLRLTAADIRMHPWKLLKQPKSKDVKVQNIYESSLALSDASSDLSETLDKLILLMEISKGDQSTQEAIRSFMNHIKTASEQLQTLQQHITKYLKTVQ